MTASKPTKTQNTKIDVSVPYGPPLPFMAFFAGFETDVALLFRVEQNTDAPAFAVQPPDRCGQRQLYDLRVVLAGA